MTPDQVVDLRALLEIESHYHGEAFDPGGAPETCRLCAGCPWPCPTMRIIQAAYELLADNERLQRALRISGNEH